MNRKKGNRRYSDQTRDRILSIILREGTKGISNKILSQKSGIDRNIVSAICVDLNEDGLIKIIPSGRWKTYFPSPKAVNSVSYSDSQCFKEQVERNIIRSYSFELGFADLFRHSVEGRFSSIDKQELSRLEDMLLNIVLKIGETITYSIIRCMSPELIRKIGRSQQVASSDTIDKLVEDWVNNSIISPSRILRVFTEELRRTCIKGYERIGVRADGNISKYQLDQKSFDKLLLVYSHMFPTMATELEQIYKNLQKIIENEKVNIKQILCKHDFFVKGIDSIIEYTCKKCRKKIPIYPDQVVTDKGLIEKLNSVRLSQTVKDSNRFSKNPTYNRMLRSRLSPSPYAFVCEERAHRWSRIYVTEDAFINGMALTEKYQCKICYKNEELVVLDESIISDIREDFKERVGEDINKLRILNNIAYHFYKNQNKYFTKPDLDFIKPPKFVVSDGSYYDEKEYSKHDYERDMNESLHILTRHKFIEVDNELTISEVTRYIRKSSC